MQTEIPPFVTTGCTVNHSLSANTSPETIEDMTKKPASKTTDTTKEASEIHTKKTLGDNARELRSVSCEILTYFFENPSDELTFVQFLVDEDFEDPYDEAIHTMLQELDINLSVFDNLINAFRVTQTPTFDSSSAPDKINEDYLANAARLSGFCRAILADSIALKETINSGIIVINNKLDKQTKELLDTISLTDSYEAIYNLYQLGFKKQVEEVTKNYIVKEAQKPIGEGFDFSNRVTTKPVTKSTFPIDKVNSNVWNLPEDMFGEKEIIPIGVEQSGSKKQINILYQIDFSALDDIKDLTITRSLEPYDKRVYIAISALWYAGNSCVTYQQIYNAMGHTSKAGKYSKDKISDSITKMSFTHIFIDNKEETEAYSNKQLMQYDSSLLPIKRLQNITVNNNEIENGVIQILCEPPLLEFARKRKQVTTIDIKLLAPVSDTSTNILTEDYLLERITRARSNTSQVKILFITLYKKVGADTRKKQYDLRQTLPKILDHYIEHNFIASYELVKDGILIDIKKSRKAKED